MTSEPNVDSIFCQAVEIVSDGEREEYLEQACGADVALRVRVDKLLAAHLQAGSFMQEGDARTLDLPNERPGSHIGPYKLRERLGEGGMGVVWAAEQKQPLRRKVALKVIKPGMDTEQVIARFEAEREALALMDHPNIARVLDAGTTEQGRPYFVMELIRGVPITEYCDAKRLTIRERLGLITHVCKAVQHAHQKGVIHRDIKPTNVLVSEQDGEPILKVIDFGVAKALFHPRADHSVYSGIFQAIGTLAYMSPEQAGLSISDIDTRADIYSLGVLLYELITGCTPFDKEQLKVAALDEAFRMIRENDPPRPSARASTLGDESRSITQRRRTDVHGLYKSIRGDLDWIVMKCLDKDRQRRYDTSNAIADDIVRFLNDQEISARAPTAGYRLRKALRRNRKAVFSAALLFTLIAAIAGLGWVNYLNLRKAQVPVLLDSARQREQMEDFGKAAEQYHDLIRLELPTAGKSDLTSHKSSYARALCKVGKLPEAEEAFRDAMSELANIPNTAKRQAIATLIQQHLAECADDLLDRSTSKTDDKAVALRLAVAARGMGADYDLEANVAVYSALARSQYENRQFRHAIATCLEWSSTENLEAGYLTYLILAAASGQVGDKDLAYDWWSAAENFWFVNTIIGRRQYGNLRRDARHFVESSNHEATVRLTVEQELMLYTRLLDRYPDIFEMRKYRGYCLFELGRWREAHREFEFLLQRGWSNTYSLPPGTLLSLFFEQDSIDAKQTEELKLRAFEFVDHYNISVYTIAAMLADRDGRLADQELWERVSRFPVASGFVLYRANRLDEAYGLLLNHGGLFPARNALSEIIRALIDWERGDEAKSRAGLERAEEMIERLGPREGIARTNEDVGFATSVIWLEPLLLLREARAKIPREPGSEPNPIDASLQPRKT